VTVSNNSFFDNSANIDLNDSGRMTVMGNIIEGARASGGIYMVNPNTKFNMIIGNWIFGQRASADSNGIYLYNGPTQNVIAGNACSEISRNGIALLNGANDNRVEGNLCFNNSVGSSGWAGVRISNAFDNVIRGNRCFDDQVTKTQAYGIVEANGADRNAIVDNDLRGNATAGLLLLGANTVVRRNIGHVTERRGVATIPAGQSSTTVSHGLVTTPGLVTLGPRDREVASAFVSARDATSFTITSLSPTTGDRQIDWYAEV
jgi:nitrous oxidase accessory protein NosD